MTKKKYYRVQIEFKLQAPDGAFTTKQLKRAIGYEWYLGPEAWFLPKFSDDGPDYMEKDFKLSIKSVKVQEVK